MPKVLIYEGMRGHGECLSSYYAYFKELGYDIDFAIRDKVADEKPLWMLDNVKIYSLEFSSHRKYKSMLFQFNELKNKVPNLFNYDLYFIGTFNPEGYNFVKFLTTNGINKNQILFQHHMNYKTFLKQSKNDITLGQNGFILGMIDHNKFPQLPASINISKLQHPIYNKKDKITLFISGLSHIHFKNFELFIKAVDKLNKEGKDIKVNLTGIREQGDYILPYSPNLNYLGRISFEEMAKHYCQDDFLFTLFDIKALDCQKDHNTFIQGRISGSRNMSIMYKIPLVAQKDFLTTWGFDSTNSISYKGHDYKQILLDLMNINEEEYNNIIDNLIKKEKEEFNLGCNNLKDKIESLKTNKYTDKVNINTSYKKKNRNNKNKYF